MPPRVIPRHRPVDRIAGFRFSHREQREPIRDRWHPPKTRGTDDFCISFHVTLGSWRCQHGMAARERGCQGTSVNGNAVANKPLPFAPRDHIPLIIGIERAEHDPEDRLAGPQKGDGKGRSPPTFLEMGAAIERIDDPDMRLFVGSQTIGLRQLLTELAIRRESCPQRFADHGLQGSIESVLCQRVAGSMKCGSHGSSRDAGGLDRNLQLP